MWSCRLPSSVGLLVHWRWKRYVPLKLLWPRTRLLLAAVRMTTVCVTYKCWYQTTIINCWCNIKIHVCQYRVHKTKAKRKFRQTGKLRNLTYGALELLSGLGENKTTLPTWIWNFVSLRWYFKISFGNISLKITPMLLATCYTGT
jgi:hypothetical protein